MPGRHITDSQMRLYMKFRQTDSVTIAAAKAGFSVSGTSGPFGSGLVNACVSR